MTQVYDYISLGTPFVKPEIEASGGFIVSRESLEEIAGVMKQNGWEIYEQGDGWKLFRREVKPKSESEKERKPSKTPHIKTWPPQKNKANKSFVFRAKESIYEFLGWISGIDFLPYQFALGISVGFFPSIWCPRFRFYIGPVKFWLSRIEKQGQRSIKETDNGNPA